MARIADITQSQLRTTASASQRDRYRVNIITEPVTGSAVIAHSFFLVTDDKGTIVTVTPRITKQY